MITRHAATCVAVAALACAAHAQDSDSSSSSSTHYKSHGTPLAGAAFLALVVGVVLVWALCATASWGHTYRTVRRYYERRVDPATGVHYGYIEDVYDDGSPAPPVHYHVDGEQPPRRVYRVPPSMA